MCNMTPTWNAFITMDNLRSSQNKIVISHYIINESFKSNIIIMQQKKQNGKKV